MPASVLPDVHIPAVSIYESVFGALSEEDLAAVAIIDGVTGAETSFGQLRGQIDALAGALAVRGVELGTVVGLLCPNVPAFATVFHGILRAGGTVTTINSLYTAGEIENQLRDSGATWLFTVSPFLPAAEAAAAAVGIPPERLVVLDGADGHPSLRELLGADERPPELHFDPATQIAVLPYSSGTTGHPKGVMLTHTNLVANVAQGMGAIGVERGERVLAVLPFFHIYGLTVLLNYALTLRAVLVTMPRFELPEFLRITSEHRCNWLFIAPPIAVALAKHPLVDDYDLSSVTVVFSGAAPLAGALAHAVAARLGCTVAQGYGMTEASPATHVIPNTRPDIDRSSVGLALPNTQSRVVDPETGADVDVPEAGPSLPGELWVRGPQVMAGYLGNAAATAETLDADGWLHTGDLATVDATGVYWIVDRLKELIKYKGYQVAPAVLEAVLLENPGIADAAVIGVSDEDGQEIPQAFVVLQQGASLSEGEVIAFVASRVAPHEKVRRVRFVSAIPKSSAGKILRRELREHS
ncbi:AMP-binding protein [Microterricola viridarii]|uniref:AMP-binding enzyme C-terminal domain-containing protein n=1 Tax=Microterricola viridarii TaxID=412690 RepID=A0A1H1U6N8_9MICO|nr:AMP-binding protein [Microterricola viridarii]SDS68074.1 AMP-binding enzyme C-terminal domain-containing protein [Microterricola viridarii]